MERASKKSELKNQSTEEQPEISVNDISQELEKEKVALNEQIASLEKEKNSIIEHSQKTTELEQERQRQLEVQKIELDELKRKVEALQLEKEEAKKIYIGGSATTNRMMPTPKFESCLDVMDHYFSNPTNLARRD